MLYDRLVTDKLMKNDPTLAKIDGTEYSDHIFMHDTREFWKLEDFSGCYFPVSDLWIEFKAPPRVISDEERITEWKYDKKPAYWGWLIRLSNVPNQPLKRVLSGMLFEEYRNGLRGKGHCIIHLCLNERGNFVRFPKNGPFIHEGITVLGETETGMIGLSGPNDYLKSLSKQDHENLIGDYTMMINPALLAFSRIKSLDGAMRRAV
jgi:hypothetical protein